MKLIISSFIMSVWLIGTGYAFWWFQAKDLRPFDTQASRIIDEKTLNSSLLKLMVPLNLENVNQSYLIHFWQPNCGCNRFNQEHVNDIAKRYQHNKFKLITIVSPHPDYKNSQIIKMAEELFESTVILDKNHLLIGKARIPASPAAAILTNNGTLAYFGPYSDSAFCGLGSSSFVEKVADLIVQGETPSLMNTMVYGCFCDWNKNTKQTV